MFSSEEIPSRDRVNAAIAYFFLAPIFLLAKRNPNFAHPFVRSHAKSATKFILVFVVFFILYKIRLLRAKDAISPVSVLSCQVPLSEEIPDRQD